MLKKLCILLCFLLIGASAPNDSIGIFRGDITNAVATYTAGQSIGGLITIEDATKRRKSTSGTFRVFHFLDHELLFPNMRIVIFTEAPTSSTITDGVAVSIHPDDASKVLLRASFGTDRTYGDTNIVFQNTRTPFRINSGTQLFMVVAATTTETFATTNGLSYFFTYAE